jgi:hypothetical protein
MAFAGLCLVIALTLVSIVQPSAGRAEPVTVTLMYPSADQAFYEHERISFTWRTGSPWTPSAHEWMTVSLSPTMSPSFTSYEAPCEYWTESCPGHADGGRFPPGRYYWQVSWVRGPGLLGVSGVASFTVQKTPPPTNSALPSISGTLWRGLALTAHTGSWSGYGPMSYSYTWLRCDLSGASCATVADGTSASYTLTADDVGLTIRVRVTAKNVIGSAAATSPLVGPILASPPPPAPPPPPPPPNPKPSSSKRKPAPKRVVICHRGRTTKVLKSKLRSHRKHGDKLGACKKRRK